MWLKRNDSLTLNLIDSLTSRLESIGKLPKNCDLSKIGKLHMASLYDDYQQDAVIRENVYCGMDVESDLSILKALVERVERNAFVEGHARSDLICSTDRSDGMAAFPLVNGDLWTAIASARSNALAEAVERYCWATWWDDCSIAEELKDCSASSLPKESFELLSEVLTLTRVKRSILVSPRIFNAKHAVQIFYLILENGGLVSGGACGAIGDEKRTQMRALGELARHAVCAQNFIEGAVPTTLYERKLHFMATTNSSESLNSRLNSSGTESIVLPGLEIDSVLNHSLGDVVVAYRCLFENQPDFVAGSLERLCI